MKIYARFSMCCIVQKYVNNDTIIETFYIFTDEHSINISRKRCFIYIYLYMQEKPQNLGQYSTYGNGKEGINSIYISEK